MKGEIYCFSLNRFNNYYFLFIKSSHISILDTLISFTTYNLGQPLNIDIDSKLISLVINIKTTNQEYVDTNYPGIIRFQSLDS